VELVEGKDRLLELVRQNQSYEQQTVQVVEATKEVRLETDRSKFLLIAQRIRLLHDLRLVYPISVDTGEQRYRIRGLEIPDNVLSGTVPDDEMAAAIGSLCHLVAMMSKYLNVPLRYRLYCHASRSAVQDDRASVFPLFLASRNAVDRERFEVGMLMLVRDVECICKERNLRVSPKSHVLAKVKRIFESVVDGF